MSDEELLTLAAKAAGVFVTKEQFARDSTSPWEPDWEPYYSEDENCIVGWSTIYGYNGELSGWGQYEWCPLTDDADALGLAVKLSLAIHQHASIAEVEVQDYFTGATTTEWHGLDALAATRRAIVRAAAAIAQRGGESGNG